MALTVGTADPSGGRRLPPVPPVPEAVRVRAVRALAGMARDAGDLRLLADMLDLDLAEGVRGWVPADRPDDRRPARPAHRRPRPQAAE